MVKYSVIFHPTNWMMIPMPIDFHMLLRDVKGCCTTTSAEVLTRCFWCCCRFWFRSRTFSHYVLNVCTPVWASSLSKNGGKRSWHETIDSRTCTLFSKIPKATKCFSHHVEQDGVIPLVFLDDLKMFKDAQSIATITRPCFLVYSWSLHL